MSRYARQTVLPQVGAEGQERLATAHVLVVGAGALAVPVLQYLVGAGVGQITLVDGDVVAMSNLHRQPLYRMDDIDRPKVSAAAKAMAALNPEVTVMPRAEWLTPANAPALLAESDIALDCAVRRQPDAFGWGLGTGQTADLGFGAWAVWLCWRLLRACPLSPRGFP